MNFHKRILVFPCGSEVALEIHRSLEYAVHFTLYGANSVDDHGRFVYTNYIGGLPFLGTGGFLSAFKEVINAHHIDAVYPATDSTIAFLKANEALLGVPVIASDSATTDICLSKSRTYQLLEKRIPTPAMYADANHVKHYPVFLKPDIGYGSRGVKKANNAKELLACLEESPKHLILEYLPGKEYTIDCFTDRNGKLRFTGPRERKRTANGISVNSASMPIDNAFQDMANKINTHLSFNGAWFFQVKEREGGELVLLEAASRMAGSSGVYRAKGINFAALSIFNAFGIDVEILINIDQEIEMDRALDTQYKVKLDFEHVYIDFDDTILLRGMVNAQLTGCIYNFINHGKKIHLITKHNGDIHNTLKTYRLDSLFDEVIHLQKSDEKWRYIAHKNAIYIDDSFAERRQIRAKLALPVFDTDMTSLIWQLSTQ